ncbi:UNVERIFIED_CONTAM: hypothetical protein NCL1_24418 [Trichonephila clavipes]
MAPSLLYIYTYNVLFFLFLAIPEVHVIPKLQSRAPGELAEMECHVIGVPTPAVSWLKNDEELKLMTDKYTIVGRWSKVSLASHPLMHKNVIILIFSEIFGIRPIKLLS